MDKLQDAIWSFVRGTKFMKKKQMKQLLQSKIVYRWNNYRNKTMREFSLTPALFYLKLLKNEKY